MHLFYPFGNLVSVPLFFSPPDLRMFGMWIKVGGVGLEGDLQQVGLRRTSHQQLVKDVC